MIETITMHMPDGTSEVVGVQHPNVQSVKVRLDWVDAKGGTTSMEWSMEGASLSLHKYKNREDGPAPWNVVIEGVQEWPNRSDDETSADASSQEG